MVQTPVKPVTLAAFLQLPETDPAHEFMNGKITQKPMPKGKHSRLQTKLSNLLNEVLESEGTGLAFSELRCTCGGASVDSRCGCLAYAIAFQCKRSKPMATLPTRLKLHPPPRLKSYRLSKATTKVIKNINHCLNHGTEVSWLIDPKEKVVIIFSDPDIPLQILDQIDAQLPDASSLPLVHPYGRDSV